MKKQVKTGILLTLVILGMLLVAGCVSTSRQSEEGISVSGQDFHTVIDSRGVSVEVPVKIERVVTVSDALIEGTMFALGVDDTIVGIGTSCIPLDYEYSYPVDDGSVVSFDGGRSVAVSYTHLTLPTNREV